jgi:hypothetical protein
MQVKCVSVGIIKVDVASGWKSSPGVVIPAARVSVPSVVPRCSRVGPYPVIRAVGLRSNKVIASI